VLKNDPAPVPGFRYVNFRGVSVGDAAGPRVAFTGRMVGVGGRHGIFLEDPDGGPGVALALEDDLGPTGQLFLRFERPSIDGAGHWVQQEKPDEVNAALVDFLAGLDRS